MKKPLMTETALTVALPRVTHDAIRAIAERESRTKGAVVRLAIERFIEEDCQSQRK